MTAAWRKPRFWLRQKNFFHVVLDGMVEKQMAWPLVLVEWGAKGVQLYVSPGTGLRWECGFMGSQGRT